ncbi:MAG TPA: S8 family serine peptidase [Bacteroidia bacterium]|nr:S8 family serine peptidase [Bacteroidia bacterium]
MKIKTIAFLLLTNVLIQIELSAQNNLSNDHVNGQLMIQLYKGTHINEFIASFNPNYGLKVEQQLSEPLAIWLLSFNENNVNENEILQKINSHRHIKAVQFNHYIEERVLEPNDPSYVDGTQWDMNNTGQNSGTNDADIDAPEAWELCTGGITSAGDTVVVAVVDGGFFLAHQDLNFWKNYAEIPGNSIDDDNNGYVDDVNGWNAGSNSGSIASSSHGTHVSGTVAAKGNNNLGVAGVNWNAKVMPVMYGSASESNVVNAYSYVFKQRQIYNQTNGAQGAFVVSTNASFGINNGSPSNYPIWCGMYDSLGTIGILSAGATMNNNSDVDVTGDIPTACPQEHLITVTNTNRNDLKSTNPGAAYGLTTIDLGAPGTTIISTYPNNAYNSISGTSMATPHVAGAVGLMISAACPELLQDYKNYPDSIALLFKDFMLDHVDPNADLLNRTVTGGRLNVHNSLVAINNYCLLTSNQLKKIGESLIKDFDIQPNPAQAYLQLFYNLPVSGNVQINVLDMAGRSIKQMQRTNFSEGYHSHIVDVQDLEAGIYFIQLQIGDSQSSVKKFIKN